MVMKDEWRIEASAPPSCRSFCTFFASKPFDQQPCRNLAPLTELPFCSNLSHLKTLASPSYPNINTTTHPHLSIFPFTLFSQNEYQPKSDRTTRKDSATQLLNRETLSFTISNLIQLIFNQYPISIIWIIVC